MYCRLTRRICPVYGVRAHRAHTPYGHGFCQIMARFWPDRVRCGDPEGDPDPEHDLGIAPGALCDHILLAHRASGAPRATSWSVPRAPQEGTATLWGLCSLCVVAVFGPFSPFSGKWSIFRVFAHFRQSPRSCSRGSFVGRWPVLAYFMVVLANDIAIAGAFRLDSTVFSVFPMPVITVP